VLIDLFKRQTNKAARKISLRVMWTLAKVRILAKTKTLRPARNISNGLSYSNMALTPMRTVKIAH